MNYARNMQDLSRLEACFSDGIIGIKLTLVIRCCCFMAGSLNSLERRKVNARFKCIAIIAYQARYSSQTPTEVESESNQE